MMQLEQARTWLFVPGNRPDRFAKAIASGADAVIIDLEDAVAAEGKDAAREAVVTYLAAAEPGLAFVRVNPRGTAPAAADLAALAGLRGLAGLVIPKAESATDIEAARQMLTPRQGVLALIESAAGVLAAQTLAGTPGVRRLAFGSVDFAADIGAEHTADALLLARCTLVLASRAAGLPGPVDGVTTALEDPDAARADAARARGLGFTGKLVVHPRQLAPVLAGLGASEADLIWARRVLTAAADGGAAAVDGELVDAAVLVRARGLLASEVFSG